MQHDAAEQLDVVVTHDRACAFELPSRTVSEGLGKQVVERLAVLETLAELRPSWRLSLGIRSGLNESRARGSRLCARRAGTMPFDRRGRSGCRRSC